MHLINIRPRRIRYVLSSILLFAVLAVLVTACGGSADEAPFGSDDSAAPKVAVAPAVPAAPPASAATAVPPTQAPTEAPTAAPVEEPAASGEVDIAAAETLFVARGCGACHKVSSIAAAVGTIGPELDGLASRSQIAAVLDMSIDNMKTWLSDPPGAKPGTAMPNLGLAADDIDTLAAWLMTLQ